MTCDERGTARRVPRGRRGAGVEWAWAAGARRGAARAVLGRAARRASGEAALEVQDRRRQGVRLRRHRPGGCACRDPTATAGSVASRRASCSSRRSGSSRSPRPPLPRRAPGASSTGTSSERVSTTAYRRWTRQPTCTTRRAGWLIVREPATQPAAAQRLETPPESARSPSTALGALARERSYGCCHDDAGLTDRRSGDRGEFVYRGQAVGVAPSRPRSVIARAVHRANRGVGRPHRVATTRRSAALVIRLRRERYPAAAVTGLRVSARVGDIGAQRRRRRWRITRCGWTSAPCAARRTRPARQLEAYQCARIKQWTLDATSRCDRAAKAPHRGRQGPRPGALASDPADRARTDSQCSPLDVRAATRPWRAQRCARSVAAPRAPLTR